MLRRKTVRSWAVNPSVDTLFSNAALSRIRNTTFSPYTVVSIGVFAGTPPTPEEAAAGSPGALAIGVKRMARRNAISMLLALELMLNAVNINMAAFNQYWGPVPTKAAFTSLDNVYTNLGQVFSVFTIIVAAAEAAVGLAIIIAFYRLRKSIIVDDADLLKW